MKARRLIQALLAITVWAMTGVVACLSIASAAAASPAPVVHVSTKSAAIGQLVQITGAGWSPVGQTVQIELCGQDARNLSSDCDQAHQYTAAIRSSGTFYGALVVRIPPSPCPCVVVVTNQGGFSGVNVPITILGAPTVAVPPQAAPKAPVALSAKVVAPISVQAWFGAPRAVTLVLRVTNLSAIAYESLALSVSVGKGRNPSGFVPGKPLAPLAVGATQVVRIPVTLPAITAGSYSVRAQVITGQGQVSTVVGTSSYPWGLFIIAALVIQAALLMLRNRLRARLGRTTGTESSIDLPELEGAPEPVPVIDLRTPSVPKTDVWTTTHRLALLLPEQSLTCSVEVVACPAISIQRTTVRAWDDFAVSPWDALHEGSLWAETATDPPSNALVPDESFSYEGRGLELELRVSVAGPELRLDGNRTILPVRVQGSISVAGQLSPVDIESTLEQTWGADSTNGSPLDDSEPAAGSLTYGHASGGDSFYLQFDSGGGPAGWLVREGRASTIVEAVRRVEEWSGPYARRVMVELSDNLGRRMVAIGTASNGMTFRENDGLVLECRTEWEMDGVAAVGEDRSTVDIDAWRRASLSHSTSDA